MCVGKCPFGAVKSGAEPAYRVYVGGTWGKHTRMGTAIDRLFTRDEALDLIGRTMVWFAENGEPKERLGKAIDRLGMEKFLADVL